MANHYLKANVIGIVNKQISKNDPPITRITFARLKQAGYTEQQAKEKIAAVLIEELYEVVKSNEKFNEERYTNKLISVT